MPYGTFELDVVGGIRGRPIKMVQGKVTGLPFPANAEIVLEGYVDPVRTQIEGPFGEWSGHYAGGAAPWPVLEVHAIYHRNDPILLGRAADGRRTGRDGALPRGDALGRHQGEHDARGRAGRRPGLVPRDGRRAARCTASRFGSAIPATRCRQASSARNAAVRPTRRNT